MIRYKHQKLILFVLIKHILVTLFFKSTNELFLNLNLNLNLQIYINFIVYGNNIYWVMLLAMGNMLVRGNKELETDKRKSVAEEYKH